MNIKRFKEMVDKWDDYKETFQLFRIWIENSYQLFIKQINLDIEEDKYIIGNVTEEFEAKSRLKWEGVDIHIFIDLCSKLGIKAEEKIKNKETLLDAENIVAYYDIKLSDIMLVLHEIEDDIEFCYGILYLIKSVPNTDRLYTNFISKIIKGLKEFELDKCLELVGVGDKRVFIAMSFSEEMIQARKSIICAVESCGYTPMLIDIKEHLNQIVPEIYKEIDESEFVVADLTGQRGGVYYEAGYAVAKNKPLVLCCNSEENPHFDVAQINTIFWKNEKELEVRLVRRIRATVGMKE